jgi:hypothetical protein
MYLLSIIRTSRMARVERYICGRERSGHLMLNYGQGFSPTASST